MDTKKVVNSMKKNIIKAFRSPNNKSREDKWVGGVWGFKYSRLSLITNGFIVNFYKILYYRPYVSHRLGKVF